MPFGSGFIKFRSVLACGAIFCATSLTTVAAVQVTVGHAATLSVEVEGTPPFSYQWLKDGNKISGANAGSYVLSSAQTSDSGTYSVTVSNSAGSTTAPGEMINIVAAPSVTTSTSTTGVSSTVTSSQVATAGHDVTFYAATNAGGQWQISTDGGATWNNLSNGGHYSGVTTGTLSVSNVDSGLNAAQYRFSSQGTTGTMFSLSVAPAVFPFPVGIAVDQVGNLYVADTSTDTVQKVSSAGVATLLAGTSGQAGTVDANGANARFNDPTGLTASADGTLYLSDGSNATIRRIATDGTVSTLAGSSTNRGNSDGSGGAATFSAPLGICRDGGGNLYVADAVNNTIRKITSGGTVSTIAGSAGIAGNADGVGNAARFNHPTGVAVDGSGNVYISDATNNTVRKVSPAGAVSTIAGLAGVSGTQDGVGSSALFNNPGGLAVDVSGTLYVADTGNSTIRKISPSGQVSTFAGLPGIAGLMDGSGSNAWFNQPKNVAIDAAGNLFVADTGNAALRKITSSGSVTTLALSAGVAPTASPATTESPTPTTTTPVQTSSTTASSPSSGSGGGGGGGAMNGWLVVILSALASLRLKRQIARSNLKRSLSVVSADFVPFSRF